MARKDPLRNFRFRVEIDGVAVASFSEVTIGAATTEVISYREGGDLTHVRQLPGLTKYSNISLTRGVTSSLDLWNWHRAVAGGEIGANRRQVVIVVLDEKGADAVRFVVSEAWPTRYEPGQLNAKGNEVFIETLELANEGVERVQ